MNSFHYFCLYKTMNSFFLNVSFPRTRREVPSLRGDRGKGAYTGQNLLLFLLILAPSDGFAATFLRQAGTAYGLYFIVLCQQQAGNITEIRISPLPSFLSDVKHA